MSIEPSSGVGEARAGATRELLVECGERLFAERGIHGVSMREIGLAAGQRNNGVTQYHFGSKAGLVRAIFERRGHEVNERRLELLAALPSNASVRSLVHAYVTPLGDQVRRGTMYVCFLARLQAEHQRDELLQNTHEEVNTAYAQIRSQFRHRVLDGESPDRFATRWRIALNLAIDALADHQHGLIDGSARVSTGLFESELIDAIAAILQPRT